MRSKPFILFIAAAIVVLATSCNKGGKSGLMVPNDAAMVFHINSSSLTSKLSWEEISQSEWFQKIGSEVKDTVALKVLKDPASSGIDTKSDLVIYVKKQGRGGYAVFEGKLKDATAFEAFNKELSKGAATVKDGDFNHLALDKGVLTWNKTDFAYIGNAPIPDMSSMGKSSSYESYSYPMDSLQQFGKMALTVKSDQNLDNDSRFASLVKDGADVHVWVNSGTLYGNALGGGVLSMMRFSTVIDGNISASSFNFDDGKITVKGTQYFGKEMTKLLTDYKSKNFDKAMLERIPSQDVVGVLAYNYPPEGLKEFLKMIGVDGLANGFLSRVGYSVDEFIKANKGDVMLAVYDYKMTPPTGVNGLDSLGNPTGSFGWKPDVKVLFATSINDKPAFDKLVMIASEQLKGKTPSSGMPDVSYKLDKNWFVAGNSPEGVDKFLSGGNTKNAFIDKISGHPFGFYLDLQKVIRNSESAVIDSSGKLGLAASAAFWQDVTSTGGDIKDKGLTYEAEVNLVDKKTNSLKQLNKYFDTLYKIDQDRKKRMGWTDAPVVDTVIVRP